VSRFQHPLYVQALLRIFDGGDFYSGEVIIKGYFFDGFRYGSFPLDGRRISHKVNQSYLHEFMQGFIHIFCLFDDA
jgi:hypothetical protein